MRLASAAVVAALLAIGGAAPAAAADAFTVHRYEPPLPAPELRLPDLDGRVVDLAELRGRVVLVFFWATW